MKLNYESAEIELIQFEEADIVTASNPFGEGYDPGAWS